jgi:hypothetical protein
MSGSAFFLRPLYRMRTLWLVSAGMLVAAGVFLRMRQRHRRSTAISQDAVSGEWLAQARGREEHQW